MKKLVLLFAAACLLSGCAEKELLSPGLIDDYQLSAADLRNLQYYVSGEVVLQRRRTTRKAARDEHALKLVKATNVDEIRLTPDTPGVAETVGENVIKVSFEEGSRFTFRCVPPGPAEKAEGRTFADPYYRLVPDGRDAETGRPYCIYRGKPYIVVAGHEVCLKVEREAVSKSKERTRKLKGRRLK